MSKRRWIRFLSQGRITHGTSHPQDRAIDQRYQLCNLRPGSAWVNIIGPFRVTSAARWWGRPSVSQATDELTGELFLRVARTHAWSPSSRRPSGKCSRALVYYGIELPGHRRAHQRAVPSSRPDPRVVAQFEVAQWEVLPDLVYDGIELNDEIVRTRDRRGGPTEAPVASAGR